MARQPCRAAARNGSRTSLAQRTLHLDNLAGEVIVLRFISVLCAIVILAGCGGSGSSSSGSSERAPFPVPNLDCRECGQFAGERHHDISRVPRQSVADARQMPVYHAGNHLHVGVDQGVQLGRLPSVGMHGETEVRYGELPDGVGAGSVGSYLIDGVGRVARRYATAPTVRVIGAISIREMNQLAHAVRLVNTALPDGVKMRMGVSLPELSFRDAVSPTGHYTNSWGQEQQLDNTIHVEFVPAWDYRRGENSGAVTWNKFAGPVVESSYIQFKRELPSSGTRITAGPLSCLPTKSSMRSVSVMSPQDSTPS